MDCTRARDSLVDLLGGSLQPEVQQELEAHLGQCEACRREHELLQRGHRALADSLPQVAPRGAYLTEQRYIRLLEAARSQRHPSRIITLRRFVAAAAAAIIVVCVPYVVKDFGELLTPAAPPAGTHVARVPAAPRYRAPEPVRVFLASGPERGNLRETVGHMAADLDVMSPSPGFGVQPATQVLRTTGRDVHIPVRNALYDEQETGYWW